jgi:triacylglycerol lipase
MSSRQARWWGSPVAETRAWLEAGRLLVDPVLVGYRVPRGDGRPVVLAPGFGAGDPTLALLAGWLRRIGYRPYTCGFVTNTDCSDRALDRVDAVVTRAWKRHSRRVAVVGHSRGGHYARAIAARRPERVSHAISMGADLDALLGASQSADPLRRRSSAAGGPRQPTRTPRSLPDAALRLLVRAGLCPAIPD